MSYNLCDEPWIPIAGTEEKKSLVQIFSDPSLQRLSGNPVDKIVIFRFLLSIVHASTPLPDFESWQTLTVKEISGNVLAYLEQHHDCFDLYGDKPFLQFPQLAELKCKLFTLGSIIDHVAVKERNSVLLTDINCFFELSDAEKVLLLLRSSCYALGGKKYRKKKELSLSSGYNKEKAGTIGTLLGKNGYLHAYLLGENLLDSLRINLLTDEDIRNIGAFPYGKGIPFWEKMPCGEKDERAKEYKNSYLGQLFPLDKFFYLKGKNIFVTLGIPYQTDPQTMRDPALTIIGTEKNLSFLSAKTKVHPWRELCSLLAFLEKDDHSNQPYFLAMGMEKARRLSYEYLTIWTGGIAITNSPSEQFLSKMDDYVESEFIVPIVFLKKQYYLANLKSFMEYLKKKEQILNKSIIAYYQADRKREKNKNNTFENLQADKGSTLFWEQMDLRSQKILDLAFSDASAEEIEQEKKTDFAVLCRIYNEICPNETPRQMTAWVQNNPGFQYNKKQKEKK